MITKTLSVSAIENGTVIDHIDAGQALNIIQLFSLGESENEITVGINLSSASMEKKDVLKIANKELTPDEANRLAIFAPQSSVNIIKDYKVAKKFKVSMPEFLKGAILCPNHNCISNHEKISSHFSVNALRNTTVLQCVYCEKSFTKNDLSRG